MATGPIEKHLHRSFNWENAAPESREGTRGGFGWLRKRPIRSMCSAEIGNQPVSEAHGSPFLARQPLFHEIEEARPP